MAQELINPCGIYQRNSGALAPRRSLEDVKVVGLFSNLKANADRYLEELSERLKARYPHLEFELFQKIASEPANFSQHWLDRVHAVAAAFGD
ncbi:MAG: hypothetical protein OXE57_08625 [Alphaproteobacteria bacterium]|nr:hypothetical protein [Alphaproteobacteria bacterium]